MKSFTWLLFTVGSTFLTMSCQSSKPAEQKEFKALDSGLQYRLLKEGEGREAVQGDTAWIFETTSYLDGTVLYSNKGADNAIKIVLGANQVIEGVELGLLGMQAGEIKELIVPPHLSKRSMYPDHISPDSTLRIKLLVDKVQ